MRLWLSLGVAIAFAVLGAVCWHRGAVIADLNTQLGRERQHSDQLTSDLNAQSAAVQQLADKALELERAGQQILAEGRKIRVVHEGRAQQILLEQPVFDDACKEAERLMDEHYAGN